jgi:hypothetical protein
MLAVTVSVTLEMLPMTTVGGGPNLPAGHGFGAGAALVEPWELMEPIGQK